MYLCSSSTNQHFSIRMPWRILTSLVQLLSLKNLHLITISDYRKANLSKFFKNNESEFKT